MKTNIISRKYGWYLARVSASFKNFINIVVTRFDTIRMYNLQPGRNIKIYNLENCHSSNDFFDRFVLIPYFNEFIENYRILFDVFQSFTKKSCEIIDKKYINRVLKIMNSFYQERNNHGGFVLKELLDFDNLEVDHMDIAMPESWLNEHSVELGETVLLRDDEPSPVILQKCR